jgi:hypothetical protein
MKMTKKPKININNNLCLSSLRTLKDFSKSNNNSTTNRNKNLKTSFSPINNMILSQSILNSFKLPKYKKKISLYPKIMKRNSLQNEIFQSPSESNLKQNQNNNSNNNNISNSNRNNQKEYLQTSTGFHNRFFSNPKFNFESNKNINKTETNSIKKYMNAQTKINLKSPSKETTLNTNTNTNIIVNKDDLFNLETPEDFHIFNVNIIQKGRKLAYKFENMENSNIEINKIGDEF